MPPITVATHDLTVVLPPPGGVLIDAWDTPPDWGAFAQPTRITIITGGGPGEALVMIEQVPDARVFLGEAELQRGITALSVGVAAMRGLDLLDGGQSAGAPDSRNARRELQD